MKYLILLLSCALFASDYDSALAKWLDVQGHTPRVEWHADKAALTALGKPGYGAANAWMYDPMGKTIYAYPCRNSAALLRHETFHAVADARLGAMPLWLNEGVAVMMETAKVTDGTLSFRTGKRLRAAARADVTLQQVQAQTSESYTGVQAEIAYSGSYAVAVWMREVGVLHPWLHGKRSELDAVAFSKWLLSPGGWP